MAQTDTETNAVEVIEDIPVSDAMSWSDVWIILLIPVGTIIILWIEKRSDKHMLTPEAVATMMDTFVKSFNKLGDYTEDTETPIDDMVFNLAKIPLDMIMEEIKRRDDNPEVVE